MEFGKCIECGAPFPFFAGSPERCVPCRKRRNGERLTKSDVALEHVHVYYATETIRLKDEIARLIRLAADIETNDGEEARRLRTQNANLRQKVVELRGRIVQLEGELRSAHSRIRELASRSIHDGLSSMFGRGSRIPEGVSVRDLIRLCHPDRWTGTANEELANEVTKKLLESR